MSLRYYYYLYIRPLPVIYSLTSSSSFIYTIISTPCNGTDILFFFLRTRKLKIYIFQEKTWVLIMKIPDKYIGCFGIWYTHTYIHTYIHRDMYVCITQMLLTGQCGLLEIILWPRSSRRCDLLPFKYNESTPRPR